MDAQTHPNLKIVEQLDPANLAGATDILHPEVIFHYFNPELPDLQGDYVGPQGMGEFFQRLHGMTAGTFRVEPQSATPVGDELVVVTTINSLTLNGESMRFHVVLVWRIVEGRITEIWDVPSIYTRIPASAASSFSAG